MDEMFAIKCQNCGGPMYSHQAKRSFECAYCGAVVPWQADAGEPKSALGIRHAPLTVVDGLLKLTHVSQLERPEDPELVFLQFALAQSVGPGTSAVGGSRHGAGVPRSHACEHSLPLLRSVL